MANFTNFHPNLTQVPKNLLKKPIRFLEFNILWNFARFFISQNWNKIMAFRNKNLCPVHLPGQNIFCPGQNIFCTGQNNFCLRQNIFVPDKIFCPRLKSSYLLGKRIENDFKLWRIFFPWLKSYFPSISQAKMYFLA